MPVQEIHLIRHGETEWSLSGRHTGVSDLRSPSAVAGWLTPQQIRGSRPEWLVFKDGCPSGESPDQVATRVDHVKRWNAPLMATNHFPTPCAKLHTSARDRPNGDGSLTTPRVGTVNVPLQDIPGSSRLSSGVVARTHGGQAGDYELGVAAAGDG